MRKKNFQNTITKKCQTHYFSPFFEISKEGSKNSSQLQGMWWLRGLARKGIVTKCLVNLVREAKG